MTKQLLKSIIDGMPKFVITVVGLALAIGYITQKPIILEPKSELLGYALLTAVIAIWGIWILNIIKRARRSS